jgi:hypothetical protein
MQKPVDALDLERQVRVSQVLAALKARASGVD